MAVVLTLVQTKQIRKSRHKRNNKNTVHSVQNSKYKYTFFEVRHPSCVSNKSDYKVYVYIVRHNYILGGMLFTICKVQLHVSAVNVGHLQVVQ